MPLKTIIKNQKQLVLILAAILIATGLILQLWNSFHDSLTADEAPHIAAAYSYVHYSDNRLNPEHPPLVKVLAGIPLQFLSVKFPITELPWFGVNEQWREGWAFLINNANYQTIIYTARLGPIFLTTVFAFLFFWIARKYYGNRVGLLALLLFTFSPTILAHGHLVTTDVAAAFGLFVGFWGFAAYLKVPTKLNFVLGSLAIALALASKFSTVIIVPYLIVMLIAYLLIHWPQPWIERLLQGGGILLTGLILLTIGYNAISFNYPVAKRVYDSHFLLQQFGVAPGLSTAVETLVQTPLVWGAGEYGLGLSMITNRAMTGSSYFFGKYYDGGSPWYFPFAYLVKEPLALHLLSMLLIGAGIRWLIKRRTFEYKEIKNWIKSNFFILAMVGLLIVFWALAVRQTINLGVRHILPVLPFTYLLVAIGINSLWKIKRLQSLTVILLIAFAGSSLTQYPHELSYANELIGGPQNLHYFLSDSNVDWGQDFKRLESYALKNNITELHLLYFGQQPQLMDPRIKVLPWPESFDPATAQGVYAISETFLRTNCLGWLIKPCPVGAPLLAEQPVTSIGNSIDIYQF